MSLQQRIDVSLTIAGDGTSTVFSFDLLKDPYNVGVIQNWFADDRPAYRSVVPASAASHDPSTYSASLSGTLVTMTFITAPAVNTIYGASIHLFFDSE